MKKLLLLDNNDSFTYNVVELIRKTELATIDVINSLDCDITTINSYDKIIFSPGPGIPNDFPIMKKILASDDFAECDILGICLGFQAICEFFDGSLVNKTKSVHGEIHPLNIKSESRLLKNVPKKTNVGLYHSWEIDKNTIYSPLKIVATANNSVMIVEHEYRNIFGVQFHPESYMTTNGKMIISNFINL